VDVTVHPNFDQFMEIVAPPRLVMATTHASEAHHRFAFRADDAIVLGPETRGLPSALMEGHPKVRIPIWGEVRSLNLSTATGILLFEALRQTDGIPEG
jgi:tRNA (cytidine/uridine-2'-O-)-methyltransferase